MRSKRHGKVQKVVLNVGNLFNVHCTLQEIGLTVITGRQRKIRCTWSNEKAKSCQNCEARGRLCVPQIFGTSVSDTVKLTAGQRLRYLENNIENLWTSVRNLESKTGIDISHDVSR